LLSPGPLNRWVPDLIGLRQALARPGCRKEAAKRDYALRNSKACGLLPQGESAWETTDAPPVGDGLGLTPAKFVEKVAMKEQYFTYVFCDIDHIFPASGGETVVKFPLR
jgi:hypothetical protein